MLTGDNRETAHQVAAKLKIDDVIAEISPADKHAKVQELKDRERSSRWLATASTMLRLSPQLMSELPWEPERMLRCTVPG